MSKKQSLGQGSVAALLSCVGILTGCGSEGSGGGSSLPMPMPALAQAARHDYSLGPQPKGLSVGDFNGDGRPDLVVAIAGSDVLSVLLNRGDGTFGAPQNYTVQVEPEITAVADLNGDGAMDIVAADYGVGGTGTTVSVLLGRGNGAFGAATSYAVGTGPFGLKLVDLLGSGRPDLLVANYRSDTVSLLRNRGDGTFQAAVNFSTGAGSGPGPLVVGDFNHDGILDLAVSDYLAAAVGVLLGNGDGTFQTPVNYAVGVKPVGIVAADFNHDGNLDLVTANAVTNDVSILLGSADGTFHSGGQVAVDGGPWLLAAGDLNGDGNLDLIVTDFYDAGSTMLSVLLGNGDGTFGSAHNYFSGARPYDVVVADFNGDGNLDVAATSFSDDTVSVLFGNGSGTLPER